MHKKKIMSVDDEKDFQEFIKILLEKEGYSVILAKNAKEALSKLKKTKPDLMLIDIMMPEMSGIELCEKIRANSKLKNLKVIFLTVLSASETSNKDIQRLNILDYITKPVESDDLLQKIKKALA
ncbi:MAG: response regulator [Nanoarchaeota archaeon]|nr:response regulator [Nanoarchaeota archaeon]MBU4457063.1 response regulator [Nanoarchaeota archaeon]MCG2719514.1 response regulator [Nanoarchaeota archaeon]